jgi:hypothetical protein
MINICNKGLDNWLLDVGVYNFHKYRGGIRYSQWHNSMPITSILYPKT